VINRILRRRDLDDEVIEGISRPGDKNTVNWLAFQLQALSGKAGDPGLDAANANDRPIFKKSIQILAAVRSPEEATSHERDGRLPDEIVQLPVTSDEFCGNDRVAVICQNANDFSRDGNSRSLTAAFPALRSDFGSRVSYRLILNQSCRHLWL
jgi:hypothetical protein